MDILLEINNYLNSHSFNYNLRVGITRPDGVDSGSKMDFSAKKQPRKIYAISADKWNLAQKLSQKEYDEEAKEFSTLDDLNSLESKAEMLESVREYLQIGFRTEDPSVHVIKYSKFWRQPDGIKLLSIWFEWLVGGSKDCDISRSITDNLEFVVKMVNAYLTDKQGEAWSNSMELIKKESLSRHGNLLMYQVALIRELAKVWGNKGEQLIYIEGKDEMKNMSNQPFIHAVSVHKPGEGDYEYSMVFSVRVGSTLVFDQVSLTEGFAAVIQICFCFNLLYPQSADDVFNFVQRVLANFGPVDGSRNAKNQVKKNFTDFQCFLGSYLLRKDKAEVKKILAAN